MATTSAKPRSKGETLKTIAEKTKLTRKQVASVFEELGTIMKKDLSKKGSGVFVVHGMMKVLVINKPATKAYEKPNPFKPGEMMTVKAKPATRKIKIRPMKALKAMVG
ncbi:MAG: HU family DNA-binding protein [Phycisphaerales bacterium]